MSSYFYIYILLIPLIIGIYSSNKKKKFFRRLQKIKNRRAKGVISTMNELVQSYIGKDCLINCSEFSGGVCGIIKVVNDNWIQVQTKQGMEIINMDFISRIRECPVNKKGKKKAVV